MHQWERFEDLGLSMMKMVPKYGLSKSTPGIGNNIVKIVWNQLHHMERRHRIFQEELPFVVKALSEEVETMPLDKLKQRKGQALFKFLWRIKEHRLGPPSYPEITEGEVSRLLEDLREMFNII
jgi:hypothetical protein